MRACHFGWYRILLTTSIVRLYFGVLTVGVDIIIQIEQYIKLNANCFFMVVEADNVCVCQCSKRKWGTKFEFENVFQYHEICIVLCAFSGIYHFAQFMWLVICEFGTFSYYLWSFKLLNPISLDSHIKPLYLLLDFSLDKLHPHKHLYTKYHAFFWVFALFLALMWIYRDFIHFHIFHRAPTNRRRSTACNSKACE